MSNKTYRYKKGFTMIEVLIVCVIIAITSSILIVNFRKGEQTNKLRLSAQQIVQNIRQVQNMALAGVEFNGEVPGEGYGIRFRDADLTSYLIFADADSDGTCGYNVGEEIRQPNFEEGVELDSICTFQDLGPPADTRDRTVVHSCFIPPNPTTIFSPGGASVIGIIINIRKQGVNCSSSPSDCRAIIIGETGIIYIVKGTIECL